MASSEARASKRWSTCARRRTSAWTFAASPASVARRMRSEIRCAAALSTFMPSSPLPVCARICVSPTAPESPEGVTASVRPALSSSTRPSSVSGGTPAVRAAVFTNPR